MSDNPTDSELRRIDLNLHSQQIQTYTEFAGSSCLDNINVIPEIIELDGVVFYKSLLSGILCPLEGERFVAVIGKWGKFNQRSRMMSRIITVYKCKVEKDRSRMTIIGWNERHFAEVIEEKNKHHNKDRYRVNEWIRTVHRYEPVKMEYRECLVPI
jgi:hypothetical protein